MSNSRHYLFFGIWAIGILANLYLLFGTKNPKLKARLLPIIGVLAGAAGLMVLVQWGLPRTALYFVVPAYALLIVLNLRQFKICEGCASLVRGDWFSAPRECLKCGAKLNGER